MGINWKIVAGQIGQTMADQENEYRKFATDYFVKRYETQAEEKRQWEQTTREQKREIDKRVDALRAEGLTDTQIANGLNTYGDNFFAVVASDLSNYKKSDNYKFLMRQDPTGGKFRDFYRERFNNLVETETQQGLDLDPVVQGLLDKFSQSTETPDIRQSIFGFDYTKGIRDDIKGLSKDTNVPDYDAPAGLVGVSDLLGGTVRDVPEQQTYTTAMLDRQIIKRLQGKYGDFKLNVDSTRFETEGEKDQRKLDKIRAANNEAVEIQRKFNEERSVTPPGSMEGGMSDQELLDKVMKDLGYGPASAGSTIDTSTADDAINALDGSTGSTSQQPVDLDTFSSNVTTYLQNNPGSNSKVSNLIGALQSVKGVNNTVLQGVLSSIALGKGLASSLKGLTISKQARKDINAAISSLDTEDKDIIRGLTGGATPEIKSNLGSKVATSDPLKAPPRPKDRDEAEIWDSIFSSTYGPQKGKIMFTPEGEYKGGFPISKSKIKEKIEQYNSAIKQRIDFIDGA